MWLDRFITTFELASVFFIYDTDLNTFSKMLFLGIPQLKPEN